MLFETNLDSIALPDLVPTRTAGARRLPAQVRKGDNSAQVNSGALITFDASIPEQALEDISNSILFCQLAADKKFDRKAAPQEWSTVFLGTLSIVGWIVQSTSNKSETARGAVDWAALATSRMSRTAARLADEGIAACDALPPTADAILIWNDAVVGPASNFFVIAAAPSAGSSTALSLTLCGFQSAVPNTGFLAWGLQYDIDTTWLDLTLNEGLYAKVRQTIIDKLGDRPSYLVSAVQLEQTEHIG
ncbi:hypothetical protein [Sphingomonas sanxanigenens]|uniref:Uncharacterized protein n=1 Tax=Sphingomonas sanxanigenens DSM 19645 = NX02 TaxID=1123269 RepID=W0A1T4_9SPHN|nr:hypothetical protein [Sphingomonas sanxanigenens]AHE51899.1 hypothetical protein NX02_00660 [Sphingomonas sanxanigenens DSM 19645 = NX02]